MSEYLKSTKEDSRLIFIDFFFNYFFNCFAQIRGMCILYARCYIMCLTYIFYLIL